MLSISIQWERKKHLLVLTLYSVVKNTLEVISGFLLNARLPSDTFPAKMKDDNSTWWAMSVISAFVKRRQRQEDCIAGMRQAWTA